MLFPLQRMIFRYNYKSNDVFYSPNSLLSFYNSFTKFEIEMNSLGNILYWCALLHIICEHLHDLYTLNSLLGWKGLEKIHTKRFFKFPSNIYSILYGFNLSL